MIKRCVTEEIILPIEYMKGEVFIDLGAPLEDYLKSLDKPKSAETKNKATKLYFVAEFENGYDEEMFTEEEKLFGDKLNMEYRRNKAVEIIN